MDFLIHLRSHIIVSSMWMILSSTFLIFLWFFFLCILVCVMHFLSILMYILFIFIVGCWLFYWWFPKLVMFLLCIVLFVPLLSPTFIILCLFFSCVGVCARVCMTVSFLLFFIFSATLSHFFVYLFAVASSKNCFYYSCILKVRHIIVSLFKLSFVHLLWPLIHLAFYFFPSYYFIAWIIQWIIFISFWIFIGETFFLFLKCFYTSSNLTCVVLTSIAFFFLLLIYFVANVVCCVKQLFALWICKKMELTATTDVKFSWVIGQKKDLRQLRILIFMMYENANKFLFSFHVFTLLTVTIYWVYILLIAVELRTVLTVK